jgi:hypothetical protein
MRLRRWWHEAKLRRNLWRFRTNDAARLDFVTAKSRVEERDGAAWLDINVNTEKFQRELHDLQKKTKEVSRSMNKFGESFSGLRNRILVSGPLRDLDKRIADWTRPGAEKLFPLLEMPNTLVPDWQKQFYNQGVSADFELTKKDLVAKLEQTMMAPQQHAIITGHTTEQW